MLPPPSGLLPASPPQPGLGCVIDTAIPFTDTSGSSGEKRDGSSSSSPDDRSDGEVVRAVLDGDREAYRLLVRRFEDPLYRHAVQMLARPDDAADVVQEAFVRGYRKLDRCRDPEKVGGWLFRIASNLCKDRLRSHAEDGVPLDDAGQLESGTADPAGHLRHSELERDLRQALDRLTVARREAFLLKHLEGRTYPEMSEMLGASVSALKMRVHRAREELQTLLEHYR